MVSWFPWFLEWYPGVSGYLVGVPANLSLVEVVRVVEVIGVVWVLRTKTSQQQQQGFTRPCRMRLVKTIPIGSAKLAQIPISFFRENMTEL